MASKSIRESAWPVVIATLGLVLVAVGTIVPVFFMGHAPGWVGYVYAAGAVLALGGRLMGKYSGSNLRVKRLLRIEVWSAVLFCTAAFFIFYQPNVGRDWLAFTLAGGVMQAYVSLMLPRALKQ